MSFQAEVINIMIASPSDVPQERQVVRDVIYQWNAVNADEKKQVLLPIGWETHSAPDMKAPPQSIINEQVLANCDILVGIFWTRIGTATTEYASGAVEEIERHIAAGKSTMLYFSETPIKPELAVTKQYRQLQKFKRDCTPKGLYEGFDSLDVFKNKFSHQLQIILKNYFAKSIVVDVIDMIDNVDVKQPELSIDEQKLLKAASLDQRGIIHRYRVSGGTYIQTNKINFVEVQSAREIAKWDAVLESLVWKELIKKVGYKGEVFEITAAGFEGADGITNTEDNSS